MLYALCCAAMSTALARAFPVNFGPSFATRNVRVDGCTISVTIGGHGPAVLLLHGYTEDSRMWRPLALTLAPRFTVIAPDLPGIGNSSIPASGIDMVTSARRIHEAMHELGYTRLAVVGHDIGLMVAYAYAAQYPAEVDRLALMDAFLPGIPGWEPIYDDPHFWHFRFFGPTPVALVTGRERTYFEYFWNTFAANPRASLPERDREAYIAAYSRPGRIAAGFAYFASLPATARAFARLGQKRLPMPVLSIGGAESLGVALGKQARFIATKATVIVLANAGHWIIEEQPAKTIAALARFLEQSDAR